MMIIVLQILMQVLGCVAEEVIAARVGILAHAKCRVLLGLLQRLLSFTTLKNIVPRLMIALRKIDRKRHILGSCWSKLLLLRIIAIVFRGALLLRLF